MLRTPGRFEEIRSIRCIVTDPCPSLGRREEASVREVADRKEWSQLLDWHLLEVSVQFANDTGCCTIFWMVNTLVRQYLEQLLVSVLGTNDFCDTFSTSWTRSPRSTARDASEAPKTLCCSRCSCSLAHGILNHRPRWRSSSGRRILHVVRKSQRSI